MHVVADLAIGFPLGKVSEKNLDSESGQIAFAFEVRTAPPIAPSSPLSETLRQNYLDPVALYHQLIRWTLSDGTPAISPREVSNSWFEVVTKHRVLFTFRDEWNATLTSGEFAWIEDATLSTARQLTNEQHGTLVTLDGGSPYIFRIMPTHPLDGGSPSPNLRGLDLQIKELPIRFQLTYLLRPTVLLDRSDQKIGFIHRSRSRARFRATVIHRGEYRHTSD